MKENDYSSLELTLVYTAKDGNVIQIRESIIRHPSVIGRVAENLLHRLKEAVKNRREELYPDIDDKDE